MGYVFKQRSIKARSTKAPYRVVYVHGSKKSWNWTARSRNGYTTSSGRGLNSQEGAEKAGLKENSGATLVRYGKPFKGRRA